LFNPRIVVPESIMPAYPQLYDNKLDGQHTADKMRALAKVGVPYTEEDFTSAKKAVHGVTEMDALVAYLQNLGVLLKEKR
jgi:cytochrome c oxidase cbb3-type subunit II